MVVVGCLCVFGLLLLFVVDCGLWFVVGYCLFVVGRCSSLCFVRCLLCVACRWDCSLFIVRRSLFVVCCSLLVVVSEVLRCVRVSFLSLLVACCLFGVGRCLLLVVGCWCSRAVERCVLFVVSCLLFAVRRCSSFVVCCLFVAYWLVVVCRLLYEARCLLLVVVCCCLFYDCCY